MSSSELALTGGALIFYPESHAYYTPPGREGGRRIPSVTQILRAVGVSEDFDAIERSRPGVVTFARDLGTAVHADAHAYDDADLDHETVDPRVRPYLDAWIAWRDNYNAVPLHRERRVYHAAHQYCGTLDGIFDIGGQIVLVDVKTGDPLAAGAAYQTAAYEAAHQAEYPDLRIHERWSVQLTPENGVPYRITRYQDWTDFRKFQAFVTTYWAQAARRREPR
jgi:hypothetical protein